MKQKGITTSILALLAVLAINAHEINFDDIEFWAGEGENEAALAVLFNDGDTNYTYVWGYRWSSDETATGESMFRKICNCSSELSLLTQYTGRYGSTVCGIGFGNNQNPLNILYFDFEEAKTTGGNAFDFYNSNSFMGQTSAPGDETPALMKAAIEAAKTTHVIEHPLNYEVYGYPSYDYDSWKLDETSESYNPDTDHWRAGWYNGYWSYWIGDAGISDLSYSGVGFSSRILANGSVDGWSFCDIADFTGGTPPAGDASLISYRPSSTLSGVATVENTIKTIIIVKGRTISVIGGNDKTFSLYNLSGVSVFTFTASNESVEIPASVTQGIYIISDNTHSTYKKFILK